MEERIYLGNVVMNLKSVYYPIVAESREQAGDKLTKYLIVTFPNEGWLSSSSEKMRELTAASDVPLEKRLEILKEICENVIR